MAQLRRTGRSAAAGLRIILILLPTLRLSDAYGFVPGSKCASKCEDGTLQQDAVCLDAEYRSTDGGNRIQSCVSCLLNSTAVDQSNNVTDVDWGLCMRIQTSLRSPLLTSQRCPAIYSVLLHVRRTRRTSLDIKSLSSDLRSSQCLDRLSFDQQLSEHGPNNRLLHIFSIRRHYDQQLRLLL